jgi:DNA-binding transcriptional MerR regulator
VIREELATPGTVAAGRRRRGLSGGEDEIDLHELCERAGITTGLARELEDYGLLAPTSENGEKRYGDSDAAVASACAKLTRFGISARHLRTFRTAADRQSGLLEQMLAPALRSRNPERRQSGLEELQTLSELAQELSQLIFWRNLRRLAEH